MGKRIILLRFDDICPTMNWKLWEIAKRMMDEAKVTALLGVVPDCTDPELMIEAPNPNFWQYIKVLQGQGFAIAMHGYHHQFEVKANGLVTINKISEFAGLSYESQIEKIRKGKEIFSNHGISTDIFFAPAHSYDDNTLRALSACGFKYMSDGLSRKPYIRHGIILLPCRSGGIPRMRMNDGYYTAVLHAHEWVRADKRGDYNRYKELLENHNREIVGFDDFSTVWKPGNCFWQRISEIIYLYAKHFIAPMLSKVLKR